MSREPDIKLFNRDCMEAMAEMPDKAFDLAIVDPPYGIGASKSCRFGKKYKGAGSKYQNYDKKNWDDNVPGDGYFQELRRVSKRQIIWGANYFGLKGGCLFWHKSQVDYSSSSGEIAHLSWLTGVQYVDILWHGAYQSDMKNKEDRIHPTQKPVALYKWLLHNYAKSGDKILDTHGGSRSLAPACYDLGFDHVSYEIDPDYHHDSVERFERHKRQQKLFTPEELRPEPVQLKIIE